VVSSNVTTVLLKPSQQKLGTISKKIKCTPKTVNMFFYSYRTITFIWLFFVILAIFPVTKSQSRDLIENLEDIIEIREQTRRFNIDRDYYFDFQARPSLPYPKFYLQ
jgi:hypothetical protein